MEIGNLMQVDKPLLTALWKGHHQPLPIIRKW